MAAEAQRAPSVREQSNFAPVLPAIVKVQPRASRSSMRLARLISLRDRADAACARFDEEIDTPAHAAYAAARAAFVAEPPPPHREVATTFINLNDQVKRLSTDGFSVSAARRVRDDSQWADMGEDHPEWRQAHLELADLADERDAIIARQRARKLEYEARARERLNIPSINKRSDELGRREYRLWLAVMDEPAESLADVLSKVDLIDRLGRGDEDGYLLTAISRDVRRIAEGADA